MRLVNLCFHGIGTPGRELEAGEAAYWISHDTFLSVLDLVAGRPEVRLSFDDGNSSDIEIGLPALEERGLTATFFVLAGRLDQMGSLGRSDVRHLHEAGMRIGTHGMRHQPWRGLTGSELHTELVTARDVLSDLVTAPVRDAALPLGRYDRSVLARLRSLGYCSVHTSDRRRARDGAWLQPRFSLRSNDTAASLEAEVLTLPSSVRRAKSTLVGLVKRFR